MKWDWSSQFGNSLAQIFFGGVGLAFLIFVGLWFGLTLSTTGFALLTFIALLSTMGSLIGSIILSIFAVCLLDYFFAQPLFTLLPDWEDTNDVIRLTAFFVTSVTISSLTARARKAVEAARASQKALVETVPGLVWSALPNGSRDFHSQRWLELTGLSEKVAAGDGWIAAFHHQDRAAVMEKWRRAVATGEPFETEARERSAEGEYRSMLVRAAPFRDAKGNIVKWYGSSTDIEDVKRATFNLEAARRDIAEREAKIRRLVDANIIGIIFWDADGRIIEANDTFLFMLGYDRDDLAARRIDLRTLTPPEWLDLQTQTFEEVKTAGAVQPFEKEYFRKDGSRVPVLIGLASLEEGGRQNVGFVLNLTEQKRAEAEMRESERRYRMAQAELAHANRLTAMGQLTASIAHEVNQPIGAMIADAQAGLRFLDARPPDLEEVREALASIVNGGFRAGDVIGRIHALVRKAPPRKERFDLNEAIREVIVVTRGEVTKNGISVEAQLAAGLPLVQGDRVQLQQVILNLIINAIEAMSGVAEGPRELLIKTARSESDSVSVAVQDTGPGLDPANPNGVFEPFYTSKPEGLGIGLSICRSIVEAHDGELAVTANVPHGAIFQFTVPTGADGS